MDWEKTTTRQDKFCYLVPPNISGLTIRMRAGCRKSSRLNTKLCILLAFCKLVKHFCVVELYHRRLSISLPSIFIKPLPLAKFCNCASNNTLQKIIIQIMWKGHFNLRPYDRLKLQAALGVYFLCSHVFPNTMYSHYPEVTKETPAMRYLVLKTLTKLYLSRHHIFVHTRVTMTSWNWNIFRITGPLCGKLTGEFPAQRPVTRSFDVFLFSFICVWINGWVNNREAGDLRRYRVHYDVIVMSYSFAVYRV